MPKSLRESTPWDDIGWLDRDETSQDVLRDRFAVHVQQNNRIAGIILRPDELPAAYRGLITPELRNSARRLRMCHREMFWNEDTWMPVPVKYCRQWRFCYFCRRAQLRAYRDQLLKLTRAFVRGTDLQVLRLHSVVFHPLRGKKSKSHADTELGFRAIDAFRKDFARRRRAYNRTAVNPQRMGPAMFGLHTTIGEGLNGEPVVVPHLHISMFTGNRFGTRAFRTRLLASARPAMRGLPSGGVLPGGLWDEIIQTKWYPEQHHPADSRTHEVIDDTTAYLGQMTKEGQSPLNQVMATVAAYTYHYRRQCALVPRSQSGARHLPDETLNSAWQHPWKLIYDQQAKSGYRPEPNESYEQA